MSDHVRMLLTLLGIVAAASAVYFALVLTVRACDKKRAERAVYPRLIWLGVTLTCVAVTVVSYISNMGWMRVMLIWSIIPLLQPIFLTTVSVVTAPWIKHSKALAAIAVINHICFVASNLMLPDFGDIGPSYVFFGLIHEYNEILIVLAFITAIASIALTVAQLAVGLAVRAKLMPPVPVNYVAAQPDEPVRQMQNNENNQYLT